MTKTAESIKQEIFALVHEYAALAHAAPAEFVPGQSAVPVSGRVYGGEEIATLVDSALEFWLTTGRYNDLFEKRLADRVGLKHALTVNSGSSANLVAMSALTSNTLGKKALQPGDEVITCATGFPTTVNPIIQNNLVPVFLDVQVPTYNIDTTLLEEALSPRTRAVMVAHALGNPFDLGRITEFCKRHDLYLIEDCCDALGATYEGKGVGTFGDIATLSFYPAHHITMGEGGAVLTDRAILRKAMESVRDWGRDCWCPPGKDNTCNKRYGWCLGDLPEGYDHKYTYSNLGYNLKITDMQAAVGLSQLDRLEGFIARRRRNFSLLHQGLKGLEDVFILPEATPKSDPSWFGFPISLRPGSGINREHLLKYLNDCKIGTRLLFGGNLLRQPYMKGRNYRVVGNTDQSDFVATNCFWIGVYPALGDDHIAYILDCFQRYVRSTKGAAAAQEVEHGLA